MTPQLYYSPFIPAFSFTGAPVPGALLYFYRTQSNILEEVYADSSLSVILKNPVQADLSGKFPNVYLNGDVTYRVRVTTPLGVPLGDDADPYLPGTALRGPTGTPGPPGQTYSDVSQLKAAGAVLAVGNALYGAFGKLPGWWVVRSGLRPFDPAEAYFADVGNGRYLERVRRNGLYDFDAWNPAADAQGGGLSPVTGTDDTLKLQRAIDLMNSLGGGRLTGSSGKYAILGELKTGPSGAKAQILWPNRTQANGAATIEIVGPTAAGTYDSTIGGLTVNQNGLIFMSNNTEPGWVFGGDGTIFAGLGYQTVVKAVMRDLTVRTRPNSAASGIDFFCTSWFEYSNVRVDTGTRTQDTPEPLSYDSDTTKRTMAIRHAMPGNGNQSRASGLNTVSGFYHGYGLGEHDVCDNLVAFACKFATLSIGNNYPSLIKYLSYQNCPNGLKVVGVFEKSYLAIDVVSTERLDSTYQTDMPAWQRPVSDVSDPENRAHGYAHYYPTKGGTPGPHPGPNAVVEIGGFYLDTTRLDKAARKFSAVTSSADLVVPNDSETALGFTVAADDNLGVITPSPNAQLVRLPKEGTYVVTFQVKYAPTATIGAGSIRRLSVFKSIPGVSSILLGETVEQQVVNTAKPLSVTVEVVADQPNVAVQAVTYHNNGGSPGNLTVKQGTGSDATSIVCRVARVA